jgi:nuclear GTP-binding protein
MPTKLRNNIKKKVTEHKKRLRKEARKMSALGIQRGSTKEKELHIPNLYPYKKQLLLHLKNSKKTAEK